ncbi:hypothetical protein C2E23DRAFT_734732 [Lenzites betulinus]|nr:hypothetical protein C2E23DRAFT_734732 [Lenzites betulinus]
MAPKPRPVRKPSSNPKDTSAPAPPTKDAPAPSTSMPPPPVPAAPLGILEGEITALSSCFQQAVVKTGQVYGFYTDVQRLGIQKYAPHPPRSLTAALGREVERYDQLCDAIESQLLRAIAVLQRDLAREEQRIKAEEEAAAAAPKLPSPTTNITATSTPPASPSQSHTETLPDGTQRPKPALPTPARRQSTISLSSLQRPAFPHKLDLSASALRIHPEEMIPSGLSSPVTLVPRSARASLPPDLVMAALGDAAGRSVDIDLTVDPDVSMGSNAGGENLDVALGSSADKPIELDFDVDMEFFGGTPAGSGSAGQHMFDAAGHAGGSEQVKTKVEDNMDMDLLNALQSVGPSASGDDIFASLGGSTSSNSLSVPASGAQGGVNAEKAPATVPSSDALLASLGAPPAQPGDASGSGSQGGQFDLQNFDLQGSFPEMDIMAMDDIFNMGAEPSSSTATGNPS